MLSPPAAPGGSGSAMVARQASRRAGSCFDLQLLAARSAAPGGRWAGRAEEPVAARARRPRLGRVACEVDGAVPLREPRPLSPRRQAPGRLGAVSRLRRGQAPGESVVRPAPAAGSRGPSPVTEQWGARERGGWRGLAGRTGAAAARCPSSGLSSSPPTPSRPGLGGVWPPRRRLEIQTGAQGAGLRLSGRFSGKGLLSKWIFPTTLGAGSGDAPLAANPRRTRTKMKTTGNLGPQGPPPTASASSPTR